MFHRLKNRFIARLDAVTGSIIDRVRGPIHVEFIIDEKCPYCDLLSDEYPQEEPF